MNIKDFTTGMRVELSPATDAWMMGDRFGTVTPVKGRKYVSVQMDRSGKVRRITPDLLTILPDSQDPVTPLVMPARVPAWRSVKHAGVPVLLASPDNARARRALRRSRGYADVSRMMLAR